MAGIRALALTFVLAAAVVSGAAQSPAADNALEAFLAELQRAVAADDRQAVAEMVRYPLMVSIPGSGLRVPVNTPADFVARYGDIVTEPLRDEIARASVLPQPGRIPVDITSAGFSIGSHAVVVERAAERLRVVSITVPLERAGGAPATSSSPREPRRVNIRVGPKPTQVAGSLAVDIIDTFLVFVPKGQTLAVQLQRVPAGAAVIRVVREDTGAPLNPKMVEGRSVSGVAADGTDYSIEVRRLSDQDAAPLPYVLSLTLR